jgi:hypothetical protein
LNTDELIAAALEANRSGEVEELEEDPIDESKSELIIAESIGDVAKSATPAEPAATPGTAATEKSAVEDSNKIQEQDGDETAEEKIKDEGTEKSNFISIFSVICFWYARYLLWGIVCCKP